MLQMSFPHGLLFRASWYYHICGFFFQDVIVHWETFAKKQLLFSWPRVEDIKISDIFL